MKWTSTSWVATPETHERTERQWVLDNIPKGGIFVDVGADIGSWAINLADHFDKVYAFEPSMGDCLVLSDNIKMNGLEEKISIYQKALSSRDMTVFLSSRRVDNVPNWFVSENEPKWDVWEKVDAVKLDNFNLSPKLIKIDVEGWGGKVLEGASKTLANTDFVVFEIHDDHEKNFMIEILTRSFNIAHKSDSGSIWYWRKR